MKYGVSFSEDLASALAKDLLKKYYKDPLGLAQVHIILPTKRACLAIKNAFMKELKNTKGFLLPNLTALYELEDLSLDIPSAISPLERTLLLAHLCSAKPNVSSYTQALKMAISLSELLDLTYQFDLDLTKLNELVPMEQFATHWQETVEFLDILHTHWPKILAERGQIDPMDRNIRLIKSLTQDIKSKQLSAPIVLAGFTDLFPALTELIEVISSNDRNLVLFDNYIQDEQHSLPYYTSKHYPQEQAIVEALTNDNWNNKGLPKDTLKNVKLIHAENSAEEALTIALLLRKALEEKNKTAALVTTDRNLARQVIVQMKRWDIQLDDSAGTPLNHTAIGTYFSLLADVGLSPNGINFLSLLKHPLSADGKNPLEFHHDVQERELFLRHKKLPWSMTLATDFSKWTEIFRNNIEISFGDILTQHIEIAEKLAKSVDRTATERLWQNDEGVQAFQLLTDLLSRSNIIGKIESWSYPEIIKMFMQQVSVRPRYGMHPRLDILGPIEARFHHPDICIIGGLNEKIFPPLPETGPWLNRSMRAKLGLPSPELKIDTLAMDFAHAFCSEKVYLTRSLKTDGAQSIPSRFIERLKAVAKINQIKLDERKANLATLLDNPEHYDQSKRPSPCPPVADRPTKLPVTQIEMWRRSPYNIYARYILNLYPLNPLENQRANALFGTLTHKAAELFYKEHPESTDKKVLLEIAHNLFENSTVSTTEQKLMKLKFDTIADFLIEQKCQDLKDVKHTYIEQEGKLDLFTNETTFTLTAKADKIDIMKDGSARIIDLKTYDPPSTTSVLAGFTPQLPLEALILKESGIGSVGPTDVSALAFWRLSSQKGQSQNKVLVQSTKEMNALIEKTKNGLLQMIEAFQLPTTHYEVCPVPSEAPEYNDYLHLTRMPEWAFAEEK